MISMRCRFSGGFAKTAPTQDTLLPESGASSTPLSSGPSGSFRKPDPSVNSLRDVNIAIKGANVRDAAFYDTIFLSNGCIRGATRPARDCQIRSWPWSLWWKAVAFLRPSPSPWRSVTCSRSDPERLFGSFPGFGKNHLPSPQADPKTATLLPARYTGRLLTLCAANRIDDGGEFGLEYPCSG
jgi:hypothetical protein